MTIAISLTRVAQLALAQSALRVYSEIKQRGAAADPNFRPVALMPDNGDMLYLLCRGALCRVAVPLAGAIRAFDIQDDSDIVTIDFDDTASAFAEPLRHHLEEAAAGYALAMAWCNLDATTAHAHETAAQTAAMAAAQLLNPRPTHIRPFL